MKKVFAALAAAAALLLFAGCARTLDAYVTVMLEDAAGVTVAGENPRTVRVGEDVSFAVTLADGAVYLGNDAGAEYKNGTLTLSRVLYPTTIRLDVVADPTYSSFNVVNRSPNGRVLTTAAPGSTLLNGERVTVTATPADGYVFSGWTLGDTAARGGELVSRTQEYSFRIESDTVLYANFITQAEADALAARDLCYLTYHTAGGKTVRGGADTYTQEADLTTFAFPNCLADRDYFVRDGYVLIEYNTKPDGTGDAYSLGSKIIILDGSRQIDLWCVWAKESDPSNFTTATVDGRLTITGYTADEETLVIPSQIGGTPVEGIAAGAVKNKSFTTLVFPHTIKQVENAAFTGNKNFTTFYMFDSIEHIMDRAFDDLSTMKNFRLNAATAPKFAGTTEGNFFVKWERLVTSQDKNRIVVMSGSSSLYGLKTPQLEEAFDGKYVVVNYGTNAGTAATFYMEVCAHFMHPGDILVQAPCTSSGTQLGSNQVTWRLYRGTEGYYNVWRYVDASQYSKIFDEYTQWNVENGRLNMADREYNTPERGMDMYGDIATEYPLNSPNYNYNPHSAVSPNAITETYAKNLARVHGMLQDAGVTVYFSYGPANRNIYQPAALTESYFKRVDAGFQKMLTVPVISTVGDYIFEGQYMSNSNNHLGAEGRRIRTERLARDIKAQMIKDGILAE